MAWIGDLRHGTWRDFVIPADNGSELYRIALDARTIAAESEVVGRLA